MAIHFRKDKEVLLPVTARHGVNVTREAVVEMLEDHALIRGLVMRLSDEVVSGTVRAETLRELGERLEAHIRLEELSARLETKEAGPRAEPWVPAEGLTYAPWPGPGDSAGGGYD